MLARPHTSTLRSISARLAVGGVATLASFLAFAPVAMAADEPPADTTDAPDTSQITASADGDTTPIDETPPAEAPLPTDQAPASTDATTVPVDGTPTDSTAPTPSDGSEPEVATPEDAASSDTEITALFGLGKDRMDFRVGVQLADGDFVPTGTTAGSTFLVTETDGSNVVVNWFTCITEGTGPLTYCPGFYTADNNSTISVVQTSAAPGLVAASGSISPVCREYYYLSVDCESLEDSIFVNEGSVLPATGTDSATTTEGRAVTIDVLANDDSDDPNTSLTIGTNPEHGTAKVTGSATPPPTPRGSVATQVSAAGTLKVVYKPTPGFSGTDTFTYALSNSNGTTSGTVNVTVDKAAVAPNAGGSGTTNDSSDASDSISPSSRALPDTGGSDIRILGLGTLLVATGGAMTGFARRRPKTDALIG